MDWMWTIFKDYITKKLAREGNANPSDDDLEAEFVSLLGGSTVTILVQEPWQNSVRFKGLAKHNVPDIMELIHHPMEYLFEHYGGGKFKLNFHEGWNFVATQNFKPEGEPKWHELPDIGY